MIQVELVAKQQGQNRMCHHLLLDFLNLSWEKIKLIQNLTMKVKKSLNQVLVRMRLMMIKVRLKLINKRMLKMKRERIY